MPAFGVEFLFSYMINTFHGCEKYNASLLPVRVACMSAASSGIAVQ
jgi:hypothetical protein